MIIYWLRPQAPVTGMYSGFRSIEDYCDSDDRGDEEDCPHLFIHIILDIHDDILITLCLPLRSFRS
jgi:hypothetical protein